MHGKLESFQGKLLRTRICLRNGYYTDVAELWLKSTQLDWHFLCWFKKKMDLLSCTKFRQRLKKSSWVLFHIKLGPGKNRNWQCFFFFSLEMYVPFLHGWLRSFKECFSEWESVYTIHTRCWIMARFDVVRGKSEKRKCYIGIYINPKERVEIRRAAKYNLAKLEVFG